jgi:TnpA family transposase
MARSNHRHEQVAEHWDRMGQLYASLKTGQVTVSVALKRLIGFSAKNRFYRANRDLGCIFNTELSSSTSRSRNCAVGSTPASCWKQMNSCSCLNLILACIVYWQAREFPRVLTECDPIGSGIDLSLLEHGSPIE